MDYRNNEDFSDPITIIYGHNMKNGSMFGAIPKYKKQSYLEKHPAMTFRTPEKNYTFEILGGYATTSSDMIYAYPHTDEKIAELQSKYGTDKLVLLSTCTYETEDARYILVCRPIEQ